MAGYYYDRGHYYVAIGWILTFLVVLIVSARLYSRAFLTRSIGSDDFTILVSACLTLAGEINDSISAGHGLGRHLQLLNGEQYSQITRWLNVNWIIVFISYFFIRTSIMLFVLRLLPPNKKLQERIILVAFFFNFAITMIGTVSYGVRCQPFEASYKNVPGARCLSQNILVVTQQVNGILACLIDITTALIPEFLLWNVQMKRKTKFILECIFALGLITAGLSIGRAATTNGGIWQKDTTWRVMPSAMFSLVEEKFGIIFASCPAIRQLFAYRRRVGTVLPTNKRQPPNTDFVSMRRRITLRDMFWYRNRKPSLTGERMPEARAAFHLDAKTLHRPASANTQEGHSPLDIWEARIKNFFNFGASTRGGSSEHIGPRQHSSSSTGPRNESGSPQRAAYTQNSDHDNPSHSGGSEGIKSGKPLDHGQGWPGQHQKTERKSIASKYRAWGLPPSSRDGDRNSRPEITAAGNVNAQTPTQDFDFAEILANPLQRPSESLQRAPEDLQAPDRHHDVLKEEP